MDDKCCIYLLKNKINNKVYVGQTWQPIKYRFDNGNGYKGCTYLYSAINKYGKDNFYYEILEYCVTQAEADYLENFYIVKYQSNNKNYGYNLRDGGARGKHSEETRKKLSKSHKNMMSEQNRKIISENNKIRGCSEETKQKMSKAHLGLECSEETKEKISKANKGKYFKLSKEDWDKILLDNRSATIIAKDYGVSQRTILNIKNNDKGRYR